MADELDAYQGKSVGELGWEAGWFVLHTLIAIAILALILFGGMALHASPDTASPKMVGTFLAILLPFLVGYVIAKLRHDFVARNVWISGLLLFAIVCVWVLDLPTGNGLCEHCGAMDKLTRTFFSIDNGSGLAGGWGLVLGAWLPLSLLFYALGAHLGLGREPEYLED